jgi:hypothetical protein
VFSTFQRTGSGAAILELCWRLVEIQAYEDGFFGPSGKPWYRILIPFDESFQFLVGRVGVFGIEQGSQIFGSFLTHGDFRDIVHRVLYEMELASLLGDGGYDGPGGRLEPGMIIACNALDAGHSTRHHPPLEDLASIMAVIGRF